MGAPIQALKINDTGRQALNKLHPVYMDAEGLILCEIKESHGAFFEIKAFPIVNNYQKKTHLLIPAHFVDFAVLEEANKTPGFSLEEP